MSSNNNLIAFANLGSQYPMVLNMLFAFISKSNPLNTKIAMSTPCHPQNYSPQLSNQEFTQFRINSSQAGQDNFILVDIKTGVNDSFEKLIERSLRSVSGLDRCSSVILVRRGKGCRLDSYGAGRNPQAGLINSGRNEFCQDLDEINVSEDNILHIESFPGGKCYSMNMSNYVIMRNETNLNDPSLRERINSDWNRLSNSLTLLFSDMKNLESRSVPEIIETLKEIGGLCSQISNTSNEKQRLNDLELNLRLLEEKKKIIEEGIKSNKDYMKDVQIKEVTFSNVNNRNNICSICNTICHNDCGYSEAKVGDPSIKSCCCISNETCTKCKCNYSTHFIAKQVPSVTTKTVKQEDTETKRKFEEFNKDLKKNEEEIKNVTASIDSFNKNIQKNQNEISQKTLSISKSFSLINDLSRVAGKCLSQINSVQNPEELNSINSGFNILSSLIDRTIIQGSTGALLSKKLSSK